LCTNRLGTTPMTTNFTRYFSILLFSAAMLLACPAHANGDLKKEEVRIYPNPFTTEATIQLSNALDFNAQKISFQVYNLVGEVVYSIPLVKSYEIKLTREPFVRGMYFYQLNIDGKVVTTGKITVK